MSAVTMRNSRQGAEPPAPPQHEDGTLYPYAMYYDGLKYVAFADTPTDLMEVLVPGYEAQDDHGQVEARIRLAIDAQCALQPVITAQADPKVVESLTEEEVGHLNSPRFEQPRVDFWNPPLPLVLVETGYAPYTDIDRPISGIADVENPPNIIWLRPAQEWEFLTSLATAGFVMLHEAADL